MPEIPCPEVKDSDFGDLDQSAQDAISKAKAAAHYQAMAAEAAVMFKPATRMKWHTHSAQMITDTHTFFIDAEKGCVRIASVLNEGCMTLNLSPAEASSIASELIKAAKAAQ